MLDVARAHRCTVALRNARWEFLETPELVQAKREIARLEGALDILTKGLPGKSLTPRERITLAEIVRGASDKEAARTMSISPRTVEFHRRKARHDRDRVVPAAVAPPVTPPVVAAPPPPKPADNPY